MPVSPKDLALALSPALTAGQAPGPACRSHDEIHRQFALLWRERVERIALTNFAFLLTCVYLPVWFVAAAALINAACEAVTMILYQRPALMARRGAHRFCTASVFLIEFSYTLVAGAIWQQDANHAKAFALGMVMVTLIHLTTVRAIHLPFGLAGFAGVALAVTGANLTYWVGVADWAGLAMSTAGSAGGLAYAASALLANNGLHRAMAEGQANAMAADAAKSRFLAQMSHELRTPLNAIIGLGTVERDRAADALSAQRLSALVTSAQGLAVVLDDILDLSAIQEGKVSLRPRVFDLHADLEAILALFDLQAADSHTGLSLRLDPGLPRTIRQDPQRLRQCVTNLLSNALRHAGGAQVVIHAARSEAGQLCIDVQDTGPGIAPSLAARLFQPFQTGPDSPAGTGLGLAISRALAERMGGGLDLMPTASGTHFRLTVGCGVPGLAERVEAEPPGLGDAGPLFSARRGAVAPGRAPERAPERAPGQAVDAAAPVSPPAVPKPAANSPAPSNSAQMPDLTGRVVLVVDDIGTNRLVAASYLAATGVRVIEAEGGAQALALLRQGGVDLVLLDMNMPGMNGVETLQHLRALPGAAGRVPVLAMTADAMEGQRQYYLGAGFDDYLSKPLAPDALAAALRTHLSG